MEKNLKELLDSIPEKYNLLREGVESLIEEEQTPDRPEWTKCHLVAFAEQYKVDIFNMTEKEMHLINERIAYWTSA